MIQSIEDQIESDRAARRNDAPEDRPKSAPPGPRQDRAQGRNGPRGGGQEKASSSPNAEPSQPAAEGEEGTVTEVDGAQSEASPGRAGAERSRPTRAERRRLAKLKKTEAQNTAADPAPGAARSSGPAEDES